MAIVVSDDRRRGLLILGLASLFVAVSAIALRRPILSAAIRFTPEIASWWGSSPASVERYLRGLQARWSGETSVVEGYRVASPAAGDAALESRFFRGTPQDLRMALAQSSNVPQALRVRQSNAASTSGMRPRASRLSGKGRSAANSPTDVVAPDEPPLPGSRTGRLSGATDREPVRDARAAAVGRPELSRANSVQDAGAVVPATRRASASRALPGAGSQGKTTGLRHSLAEPELDREALFPELADPRLKGLKSGLNRTTSGISNRASDRRNGVQTNAAQDDQNNLLGRGVQTGADLSGLGGPALATAGERRLEPTSEGLTPTTPERAERRGLGDKPNPANTSVGFYWNGEGQPRQGLDPMSMACTPPRTCDAH
ncbi:MAG: hypothetical protein HY078_03100 [Elusimicrobia bacterium]|nr:hypothetical protein [Elusimicrobiota bacterium]